MNIKRPASHRKTMLMACSSLACFWTVPASAQSTPPADPPPAAADTDTAHASADGAIGDIVVTARRKEENAQRVPISVLALSPTILREQNIVNLVDLPRVAPGLTVTPTALGSTRPAYQIRGQRAAATRIQSDPAIVVYFAEVGQARAAGTPQSLFDIDSVQVLKGPQGTLFGRNTTGGAILITPKAPTRDFGGYVDLSAGDFGMRSLEAALNVPVVDKVYLRVAGKIYRRDGYFSNTLRPGEKSWDERNESLRVSLRIQPSDGITTDFIGTVFHSNVIGFQPKISYVLPSAVPVAALAPGFVAEVNAANALGFYEYREFFKARNFDNVKAIQNTTTVELTDGGFLGKSRIKNIIAYRQIRNHFSTFADGSALGILNTFGDFDGTQFSEELQLQGKSGPVDYVLGLFYSTEEGSDFTNAQTFRALPLNYTDYDGKNSSRSAFAHVNVDLGSGFSVAGGARITRDDRTINSHVRQLRNPTTALPAPFVCQASGVSVPIANLDDRSLCSFITKARFTEPTWDIGFNYQVDPNHLLYVAHRHGYRSGAARSATTPDLRPEKVNDIEIGSKNQFDLGGTPVRFNLIGYYGKYQDLQRNIAVILNGVAGTQDRNAAKAHVYGLESEFEARFGRLLTINASYALTISKYDEYSNSYNTPTGLVIVDNTSSIFSYAPKHMISVSGTLHIPAPESVGEPSLTVGYAYQTKFQTTDANSMNCGPNGIEKWCLNQVGMLPGYGLLNLRADWRRMFGSKVDLSVFVTNALDKKYYAGRFALVNALGFASSWPGPPRMFGAELRMPFGDAN
jgi:iron complex outermembrane receptor protein